jgi:hypothetical protein
MLGISRTPINFIMTSPSQPLYMQRCPISGTILAFKPPWSSRIDPGVPIIQSCPTCSDRSRLNFSLTYFYSSLDRFFGANYVPTYQDITQVASAKGTLPQATIKVHDAEITFVDADLRKEPPDLSDVACILFVVNLAAYDKSLCLQYSAVRLSRLWLI